MNLTCRWTTDGTRVGVGVRDGKTWKCIAVVNNPTEGCLTIQFATACLPVTTVEAVAAYIQERPWEKTNDGIREGHE